MHVPVLVLVPVRQRACPCPGRPETARIPFSTARLVQVSPEVGLPAGGEASATEEA